MISENINLLVIEDNKGDYLLIKEMISECIPKSKITWKQTLEEGIQFLKEEPCDILLLDLGLPDSHGLETLEKIVSLRHDSAIIILSGSTNDQDSLDTLKNGAHYYLTKDNLNPGFLHSVIRYALEKKETEKFLLNHQTILEKEVSSRTKDLIDANLLLKEEIKARIETEANLMESEENFRLISTSAKDAIVKMDHLGKISFWNPAAENIFGYTADEMIGKNPHEFITPKKLRNKAQKSLDKFLKTGEGNIIGKTVEIMAYRKDGKTIPIEISLSTLKLNDEKYQAIGIIRDITERKHSENKIRESNIFLQTLLNTLPVPIFYKDIDGIYLGGNSAFFEFLGKTPEEIIGTSNADEVLFSSFIHAHLARDNGQKKLIYESKIVMGNGNVRDVIYHQAAYNDALGEIAGTVGVFLDITELKKTTTELKLIKSNLESIVEKRTQQLEESNATKDKFFSIIAHDLKSPFNVILGFLTLIHSEFDEFSKEELKSFVKKTLDATKNTFTLLENLLEWSRSKQGTISFKPKNTHLSRICNEVIDLSIEFANSKKITIVNEIDPTCMVFADENMLKSIFRNLISNAMKFSYHSSTIRIFTEESYNLMEVCVEDHGMGMNETQQKDLFAVSEEIQRPGTNNEKGSGLGLILCKEFIEKNNGHIRTISQPDKGSTFCFSLPKAIGTN